MPGGAAGPAGSLARGATTSVTVAGAVPAGASMPGEDVYPNGRRIVAPAAIVSPGEQKDLARAWAGAVRGEIWRREPLHRKIEYARRAGLGLPPDPDAVTTDLALEGIAGSPHLLPGNWLRRGADISDTVALLETPAGDATGFLVSDWLLMTNAHVLPSAEVAARSTARFRHQENAAGRIGRSRQHTLDPDRFFLAEPGLDYAVVAVAAHGRTGRGPGRTYGFVPLIGATGKILLGQPVNVVQHAGGRSREIAVRDNRLLELTGAHLVYAAGAAAGSSGAPIFNDRWELVALHRRLVETRDAQGRLVDIDEHPVIGEPESPHRRWTAGQGVRVSAIVTDLGSRGLTAARQILLTGLLTPGGSR
ncbi:serine protease [Actinoplanes sp. NEAU-A12]|uniref:Serine protease n=1 Tax=Actinoplanes sandaracinus TaxID=3045177 RepID=A0ABT6WGS0_9ACTN|nr:serine protease [Actinoplanes sandaracinus]MDI6098921.1 serine protease [Actinoplanes sandaracinus]